MSEAKPFSISKQEVWEAYQKVKANQGAAGVDGQSIAAFETRVKDNLYRIWNRMSSGSYFPPPVRTVTIPKANGGERTLGIPTVSDRIAQMVVKSRLEPVVDPLFHPDSYGYRPGKSALEAVGQTRQRCWKLDWVIDLDIKGSFERINTQRLFKFVCQQIRERELQRLLHAWLTIETVVVERTGVRRKEEARGLLQGGVISPLLANVYLDRFDKLALKRGLKLVRYGDDIVVCCSSKKEAEATLKLVEKLLAKLDLTVNPRKTVIVHAEKGFDYLGKRLFLKTTEDGTQHVASWRPKVPERPVPALLPATTPLSDHTGESDVAQRHSEP